MQKRLLFCRAALFAACVCVVIPARADDGAGALAQTLWSRFLERYGIAAAIETVCPGHEAIPAMQDGLKIFADASSDKVAVFKATVAAMALAADTYNLKSGRAQFCRRALADHGPDSDDALVVRKR